MKRETPAVTAVTRRLPDGSTQTIYTCAPHVMRVVRELGGRDLDVREADPAVHGCKGCLEDWAP